MTSLTLLLISALLSPVEEAQTDENISPFNHLDADANGVITREELEFIPQLYQEYESIDADESGTIDKVEFSAFEVEN